LKNNRNNVLTDKNGNVFKKDNNGNWQQRTNDKWTNYSRKDHQRQGNSKDHLSNMNRQFDSRSRGNQRTQNFKAPGRRRGWNERVNYHEFAQIVRNSICN